MLKLFILSLLFISLIQFSNTAYCNGRPGPIQNNTKPIWDGVPRLIKEIKNGKRYEIGSAE